MLNSLKTFSVVMLGLSGAACARAATTCNGVTNNLVANCSFQTGTFAGWSGTTTTDPNNVNPFTTNGIDTGDPNAVAGSQTPYGGQTYEAYLGSEGYTDTLTQVLSTVSGASYTVKFALLNDTTPSSPYTDSFLATFGGSTLLSQTGVAADAYTLYTYIVLASSSSTSLSFTTENDEGDFELDSISVAGPAGSPAITPEPGSLVLLGTGVLGLAGAARRRFTARS